MFVVRDWTRNPSYTMVSNDVKDVRDIVIGITGDETIGGSCMKSVFWMKLSSQSTKRSSSTNSPPEYRILTKQSHTKRSILP